MIPIKQIKTKKIPLKTESSTLNPKFNPRMPHFLLELRFIILPSFLHYTILYNRTVIYLFNNLINVFFTEKF